MSSENNTIEGPLKNGHDLAGQNLDKLIELAAMISAAQDAMTDDIVTRLASTIGEGITLLDRLTRNEGLMYFLQVLGRPECEDLLIGLSNAIVATSQDISDTTPAQGGYGGLLKLARDPGAQEGIRLMALFSEHLAQNLREINR